MKELKLNDMRELNFNEIEEVSEGNWFFRLFFRSSEAGRGSDITPSINRDWINSPLNYNSYNNRNFV